MAEYFYISAKHDRSTMHAPKQYPNVILSITTFVTRLTNFRYILIKMQDQTYTDHSSKDVS